MRWFLYLLVVAFPHRAIRLGAVFALTAYYSRRTKAVLEWVEEHDPDSEVRMNAALINTFTDHPLY